MIKLKSSYRVHHLRDAFTHNSLRRTYMRSILRLMMDSLFSFLLQIPLIVPVRPSQLYTLRLCDTYDSAIDFAYRFESCSHCFSMCFPSDVFFRTISITNTNVCYTIHHVYIAKDESHYYYKYPDIYLWNMNIGKMSFVLIFYISMHLKKKKKRTTMEF